MALAAAGRVHTPSARGCQHRPGSRPKSRPGGEVGAVAQRGGFATQEEMLGGRSEPSDQFLALAGGFVALAARCARYDLPLIFTMIAPSTTRSRKAIASGGSPREGPPASKPV